MFNIGFPELALIFTAALLLLGPKKLPEFARWVGGALREFRQATNEVRNAIDMELEREEFEKLQQEFQHVVNDPAFSTPLNDNAHDAPNAEPHDSFEDFSPATGDGLNYPPMDPDLAASHPELADDFAHITQAPEGTVSRDEFDNADNDSDGDGGDGDSGAGNDDNATLHTSSDHPTPEEYPDTPIEAGAVPDEYPNTTSEPGEPTDQAPAQADDAAAAPGTDATDAPDPSHDPDNPNR